MIDEIATRNSLPSCDITHNLQYYGVVRLTRLGTQVKPNVVYLTDP